VTVGKRVLVFPVLLVIRCPMFKTLLMILSLSIGCAPPVEGDDAGECSDGADNDLNGLFDCDDDGCIGSPECPPPPTSPTTSSTSTADDDSDGYAIVDGDCDDTDASINPGATEVWYDGVDQNCDGASDYDQDGDTFDSDTYKGDDCDDLDPAVNPAQSEVWGDGIDQDCDGVADVSDSTCKALFTLTMPDGSTASINGCQEWALSANFEYDPDDVPEITRFDLEFNGTNDNDFECVISINQENVCGMGFYDVRENTSTVNLVTLDCSDVSDEYEGAFPLSTGYLQITNIDTGSVTGSFKGVGLDTQISGHLSVANPAGFSLVGDFDIALIQLAGDSEEQFDCAVTDGDADADGYIGTYFDGLDCNDNDPALTPADIDGDTYSTCAGDCDDADATLTPADTDGDTYSTCQNDCDDTDPALTPADNDGDGYSTCAGDCDDTNPALEPRDFDGDGYSTCDGDCNDQNSTLNLTDGDSDGYSTCTNDCDDADPILTPADLDGDGYSTCTNDCDDTDSALQPRDLDSDGYSTCDGDCDDTDPFLEIADVDADGFTTCDGDCNDNVAALTPADGDADGYSTCTSDCDDTDPTLTPADLDGDLNSTCNGDCDDTDPSVEGRDLDSDGYSTCDGDCNDTDPSVEVADADADGFTTCAGDCNDYNAFLTPADADADGYSTCDGDCNDATATLSPADIDGDLNSTCNGDCDDTDPSVEGLDVDADGYSTCDGDCDDTSDFLNPLDDDADGYSTCDGDCDDTSNFLNPIDLDSDGFTTCDGDCDDYSALNNPGDADGDGNHTCNDSSSDDDCDDFDPMVESLDQDGDGVTTCEDDCDDFNSDIYPDAYDTPMLDQNCDGAIDVHPLLYADYQFLGDWGEDYAGHAVSFVGDTDIVIGAYSKYVSDWPDCAGCFMSDAGSVYYIYGSSLGADSALNLEDDSYYVFYADNQYTKYLGKSVSTAGDVDGDGIADFLAGSPTATASYQTSHAYLVLMGHMDGNSSGTARYKEIADYSIRFSEENDLDAAGHKVASAGDVDGDGRDDILITALYNDDGGEDAGKVYLFLSGTINTYSVPSSVSLSEADYTFTGQAADDQLGEGIAGAGDVDNDGLADILIGAPGNDDGGSNAGKVYLILGSSLTGTSAHDLSTASYTFVGEAAGDALGYVVSTAGNIDGDGLADIAFTASGNDDGGSGAGKTYIIFGASLGATPVIPLADSDYAILGDAAYGLTGTGAGLASAGDMNSDGRDDLLIGSQSKGTVFLVMSDTLSALTPVISLTSAAMTFTEMNSNDRIGSAIAGGGDPNGDGLPDILLGAPGVDIAGVVSVQDEGAAYLILNAL
jgi:hypothetical protein